MNLLLEPRNVNNNGKPNVNDFFYLFGTIYSRYYGIKSDSLKIFWSGVDLESLGRVLKKKKDST